MIDNPLPDQIMEDYDIAYISDQFKEMKNLDVIKIIKNHYGQEWIEVNTND